MSFKVNKHSCWNADPLTQNNYYLFKCALILFHTGLTAELFIAAGRIRWKEKINEKRKRKKLINWNSAGFFSFYMKTKTNPVRWMKIFVFVVIALCLLKQSKVERKTKQRVQEKTFKQLRFTGAQLFTCRAEMKLMKHSESRATNDGGTGWNFEIFQLIFHSFTFELKNFDFIYNTALKIQLSQCSILSISLKLSILLVWVSRTFFINWWITDIVTSFGTRTWRGVGTETTQKPKTIERREGK